MFNFLKKQSAIGIDISDYSIEILQLSKNKDITAYNRIILEEGIIEDGKILQKEKLVEKLKEALKGVKAKKAIIGLPESKVFIGDFKIIPWLPEEVYTDKIGNLQVAAPKEIVEQYAEVVKLAGIEPIVIDIESISLSRALIPDQKQDSIMLADIGARTTNLSFFNQGVLQNSVTIPIAGNHFTKAVADNLKIEQEEAEKLKRTFGFDDKKADNKILSILQASFQKIIQEIKDAISYYEKQSGGKISEIILTGGSALLPKVDEYLAVNIERKIKKSQDSQMFFANVIGLALRGIGDINQGINLLPEGHKLSTLGKNPKIE